MYSTDKIIDWNFPFQPSQCMFFKREGNDTKAEKYSWVKNNGPVWNSNCKGCQIIQWFKIGMTFEDWFCAQVIKLILLVLDKLTTNIVGFFLGTF